MPRVTIKLMVSMWALILISTGSVTKVVGPPQASEPCKWVNAIGVLSSRRHIPSLSTTLGLTRHLVHPESNNAVSKPFHPEEATINSMVTLIVLIFPLTSRSSSPPLPFSMSSFRFLARVHLPSLDNGVNSMTLAPLYAPSLGLEAVFPFLGGHVG